VIRPLHDVLAGAARPALLLLLGAVGLVLLIACANVANLLLVRATARRHELTVRAALGASRGRLVRQLLVESALLAAGGGVLGVLLAAWGTDVLVALARSSLPQLHPVEISTRVLVFAVGVSALTALIFGLLPALRASRVDPAEGLKQVTAGATSAHAGARKLLVAAEVALAVVLLSGAGLLVESFRRVTRVAPGFEREQRFIVQTSLPGAKYRDRAAVARFADEVGARLAAIPGVTASAVVDIPPLSANYNQMGIEIDGRPPRSDDPGVDTSAVSPGYFAALGIPLHVGRDFSAADRDGAAPVAVVDEAMARRLGDDAVGKRFRWRQEGAPWITVVGVAGSVKAFGLDAPARPQLYVPFAQRASWSMSLVLRSALPPAELHAAAAAAVRASTPGSRCSPPPPWPRSSTTPWPRAASTPSSSASSPASPCCSRPSASTAWSPS
jgi:predicted permease